MCYYIGYLLEILLSITLYYPEDQLLSRKSFFLYILAFAKLIASSAFSLSLWQLSCFKYK